MLTAARTKGGEAVMDKNAGGVERIREMEESRLTAAAV